MNYLEFANNLVNNNQYINNLNNYKIKQLYNYMELLLDWNKKINLTAITEPKEIIIKHFIDSMTINKYIENNSNIIDIGTGAGFPGLPIKIINDNISVTLLDSLNKRIKFLDEVISNLNLEKVKTVHSRAEDAAQNKQYRQKFDFAVSRAVAPLNYLLEYMLPFVKINGKCICMKGSNYKEELNDAEAAIFKLGGEVEKTEKIKLPNTNIERNIIIIKKIKNTPKEYPRKAGIPKKMPIC